MVADVSICTAETKAIFVVLYKSRLRWQVYNLSTLYRFVCDALSELRYDIPVIPVGIDIYETYHPGAVVRILACNANPGSSDDKKRKPGEVE